MLPMLIEKILRSGKRIGVLCDSEDSMNFLDKSLWTFSSDTFLPHGTKNDPEPEIQPVFLTTDTIFPNTPKVICIYSQSIESFGNMIDQVVRLKDIHESTVVYMFESDHNIPIKLSDVIKNLDPMRWKKMIYVNDGTSWKEIEI